MIWAFSHIQTNQNCVDAQTISEEMIMNAIVELQSDLFLLSRIESMRVGGMTLTSALEYMGVSKWKYGALKQVSRDYNNIRRKEELILFSHIRAMQNTSMKLSLALRIRGLSNWQYGLLKQKLRKHVGSQATYVSPEDMARYLKEICPVAYGIIQHNAA